jgi:hypothetical protein
MRRASWRLPSAEPVPGLGAEPEAERPGMAGWFASHRYVVPSGRGDLPVEVERDRAHRGTASPRGVQPTWMRVESVTFVLVAASMSLRRASARRGSCRRDEEAATVVARRPARVHAGRVVAVDVFVRDLHRPAAVERDRLSGGVANREVVVVAVRGERRRRHSHPVEQPGLAARQRAAGRQHARACRDRSHQFLPRVREERAIIVPVAYT